MNGKGDKPRNIFNKEYRNNYDFINWGRPRTIDEVCDSPKGSFKRFLKEQVDEEKEKEEARAKRIRKAIANK